MRLKLSNLKVEILPIGAWIFLCGFSLVALDTYLIKIGHEFIDNWSLSEAVSIQEGNLISSLSKSERFLLSSKFVKGIQIVDPTSGDVQLTPLAEFGTTHSIALSQIPDRSTTVIERVGLFEYLGFHRIGNRVGLVAIFEIRPDFMVIFFTSYCVSLGVLILIFFLILRGLGRRESEMRVDLIRKALNELSTSARPGAVLLKECPALIYVWDGMRERLAEYRRSEAENLATVRLSQVATQMSHDIRSPLAALEMITIDLAELPEEKRFIIRSAVGRIKDIANDLLSKNRFKLGEGSLALEGSNQITSIHLLSALIESVITEKRIQFRSKIGIDIDYELGTVGYGVFANVQPSELKRVLSNLINNSIEACGDAGKVVVGVQGSEAEAKITIRDNGKGIPLEILPTLMRRGVTHDKIGGSGLGLYHARVSSETWGACLTINSENGKGTEVCISFPRVTAPKWFVPKLILSRFSEVVVLDDDASIHQIWRDRFERIGVDARDIHLQHFSSAKEVEDKLNKRLLTSPQTIFLFDYELTAENTTGLILIEKLGISRQSILVTSHYEEVSIRQKCEELGVKLIPKGMAGFVPIVIRKDLRKSSISAVLIDDDDLIHMLWTASAKRFNCYFLGYRTVNEFFAASAEIDRSTPIFIDSLLEPDWRGETIYGEQISQDIFKMGFHEIYVVTGRPPSDIAECNWIKGVRGKEPPFGELGFKI